MSGQHQPLSYDRVIVEVFTDRQGSEAQEKLDGTALQYLALPLALTLPN
jgi:hypothetical protein